ncbi:endoplasmic reticulum resident protein 44-like [Dendronephthya gigantea]|uniref:endoplasmic reticulum resident protein 44-like n=1 Tax=Dendronephthya gigantea TaxID=151771 RepID=UPI001069D6D3|nr:endoplasmic reticulum resident protein 44-like [Dendronephthya gigantea]
MLPRSQYFLYLLSTASLLSIICGSSVVDLNHNNVETELGKAKVTFVNFYADWCRFSQMLKPTFEQTANILKEEFPNDLVLARIDCEDQQDVCQRFNVNKYPTLKVFRNGQVTKREFRGQRTVDGLSKFCRDQLSDRVHEFHASQDLHVEQSKRNVIGYFESKEGENFKAFEKVADQLRDDCEFHVGFGDASARDRQDGDKVVFKSNNMDVQYGGPLNDEAGLKQWASENCVPLVRVITFENAEELTEEGIPFLLLFHHPDDKNSAELYRNTIQNHFRSHKGTINFLTADGIQFSHPLHHLGKSASDLPLICIDSFRHMYTFPRFDDIKNPANLEKFLADFHSGKLHREFHHGPDPTEPPQGQDESDQGHPVDEHGQRIDMNNQDGGNGDYDEQTDPPETVFKKLKPSHDRYTLLKDEL